MLGNEVLVLGPPSIANYNDNCFFDSFSVSSPAKQEKNVEKHFFWLALAFFLGVVEIIVVFHSLKGRKCSSFSPLSN